MSGFFTNLASRARAVPLGPTDVVRPRLPSRFEPSGTGAAGDSSPEFTLPETALDVEAPVPLARPSLRPSEPVIEAPAARSLEPAPAALPVSPAPVLQAAPARGLPLPDAAVPQVAAAPVMPAIAAPPPPRLGVPPVVMAAPAADPGRRGAHDDVARPEIVRPDAPRIEPEPRPPVPRRERGEMVGVEPSSIVPIRPTRRAEPPIGERAAPLPPFPAMPLPQRNAARPSPWSTRQPPAAPAQPEIRISIGRIEVRAVTTPSETRRAAATSPVMTLEAYLRSRAGERRG